MPIAVKFLIRFWGSLPVLHFPHRLRMFRYLLGSVLFLSAVNGVAAQILAGSWEGTLSQDGQEAGFYYQVDLEQEGGLLSGASFSRVPDTENYARFEITGVVDGEEVVLQEIRQLEPEKPKWCLKYITLKLSREGDNWLLSGRWTAEGCTPGDLTLRRPVRETTTAQTEELPFSMTGEWTGHLSQSDREYGFFYRFELEKDGTGESYIVSEDNGGSAYHALRWVYDEASGALLIREREVVEKTDPRWAWCIKTGRLKLRRTDHQYVLEGDWDGYLEGHTMETGACASGGLYLEKPVRTREVVVAEEEQYVPYEAEKQRKVKLERVLEVKSPKLRIKVWDNGTVDGDVVTLFLNGEQLLENYRVTKAKRAFNVELNQNLNFLILHAEDLGEITPNTVAVAIDDGVKEHILILSSNLRESGAVMIKQFKF